MRSKVWEAQDALYAAIDAADFPGRLSVSLGLPGRFEPDNVWVSGEVDDWTSEYRASGLQSKEEVFDLKVNVYVTRLGTYTDARDRCKEIGQVVEDAVAADFTLNGTVMLATIRRSQIEETVTEDGRARGVLLTLYVRCDSYVTPTQPAEDP
jgi:hypothetical protein